MYVLKIFENVKILKFQAAVKRMTSRFVVNAPTNCATLLDDHFNKKKIFIKLHLIL